MTFIFLGAILIATNFGFTSYDCRAADPAEETYPLIGKFKNTHYYSAVETDYPRRKRPAKLRDMRGRLIAKVSKTYKRAVDIEGTGKLKDGRVINYAGRKGKEVRYHVTSHPFGHGVGDCELIPFKTIASDPRQIPLGSIVQIDETVGMKLPDGTLHDGVWRVQDIGGGIQGKRIDLFVGEGDQGEVLQAHGIYSMDTMTVRLVAAPTPAETLCLETTPR